MCGVQWGDVPYPSRDSLARYRAKIRRRPTADRDAAMSAGLSRAASRGHCGEFQSAKNPPFSSGTSRSRASRRLRKWSFLIARIFASEPPICRATSVISRWAIFISRSKIGGENVVPTFYSGNLDRYNRGERHDPKKGVYLVEIDAPRRDRTRQATWLDLPVTPFYDIEIRAEEVEELPARYSDLDRAFVHVTLDCRGRLDPMQRAAPRL